VNGRSLGFYLKREVEPAKRDLFTYITALICRKVELRIDVFMRIVNTAAFKVKSIN